MNKLVRLLNRWGGVDVEGLQQRLQDMMQQEKILNDKLQELRSINEQLNKQLQDEQTYRQKELKQLNEKDELIESWHSRYEDEIKTQETTVAECEELKVKLEAEQRNVARLELEVKELQKDLIDSKGDKEEVEAAKEQMEKDLNGKLAAIQKDMEKASAEAAENEQKLNAALEDVRKQLTEREASLKDLASEKERLSSEMSEMEQKYSVQLENMKKASDEEKAADEKSRKEQDTLISQLQQDKERMAKKMQDDEMRYAKEKESALEEKDQLYQKLKTDFDGLQIRMKEQSDDHARQIQTMEDEAAALKKKLEEARQAELQINADKRQMEEDGQAQVETLEKALSQLKEQMENQSRESERKAEAILAEKTALEAKLAEQTQNTALASQSDKVKYENEINRLKEACEQARQELERKNEDYASLQERSGREMAVVQDKLVNMEEERKTLVHQNESAQSDNEALRDKLVSLETERVNLLQENKTNLKKLETAEQEILRLNALLKDVRQVQAPKERPAEPEHPYMNAPRQRQGDEDKWAGCPENLKQMILAQKDKPYLRLTVKPYMSQCIFDMATLTQKNGRLLGTDCVLNTSYAVNCDDVIKVEGLDSPYLENTIKFNPDDAEDMEKLQAKLAEAVMNYRPIRIDYLDRNGIVRPFNLYWICFLPLNDDMPELPCETLFQSMLNDEVNPEYIIAKCAKDLASEVFELRRILSVRQFNSFSTSEKGINALADGLYYAVINGQVALAELIYGNLPQIFRKDPYIISNYAHCCVLKGNLKEALHLYLSIDPGTKVDGDRTWKDVLASDFEDLVDRGLEVDNFMAVIKQLVANGWNFE